MQKYYCTVRQTVRKKYKNVDENTVYQSYSSTHVKTQLTNQPYKHFKGCRFNEAFQLKMISQPKHKDEIFKQKKHTINSDLR